MTRKRMAAKKPRKRPAKGRRRTDQRQNPKPSLELTNYLLESHPEFEN